MESFNTLLKSTYPRYYESRRFTVGGYRWTLFVYPNGKEEDGGSGYLSLYVAIDSSSLVPAQPDVYADLRFYIFNNNEKKYFTIQDTNVWKFNAVKTMWGFSQALPRDTFKDPKNGYLFDGDHSEFGVDVTIPSAFKESEVFSLTESFPNPIFSRRFLKYSMLDQDYYMSDMFTIGGRSWNLQVNPNSQSKAEGNYLMMYLFFNANGQKMKPYDKFYVRAKLRVLSQRQENNFERQLDAWYMGYEGSYGWGVTPFMPLSELRDPSKGFLVNDMLNVEVELKILSSTKYLPP
ncbi:hypothetical protein AALP_AA3G236600 [Arabis alpina]|uniref:MATH domain-containing protein n=1 Tax=Arabis alpina TaxID=50452 RepID=A0A087HB73_ARAAL|nr:hypothetical protein AALP_AA3G236600 [Arabis alpina]